MARSLLLLGLLFFSCKESIPPVSKDYYPIALNNEWLYQVNSTIHSISQEPVSSTYLYREKISTRLGEGIYRLDRSTSKDGNNWVALESQILAVSPSNIFLNNQPMLYLPTSHGDRYPDGTSVLNSTIYQPLFSNQLLFENQNDSSAIRLKRRFFVLENQIGPIKYSFQNLDYCQETPECIGQGIISSGVKEERTLISFKSGL